MELSYQYDDDAIRRICENLWKEDIHPNWRKRRWKRIVELFYGISPALLGYLSVIFIDQRFLLYELQQSYIFFRRELFISILCAAIWNIWLCDMEVVEYWRWKRKIKKWMHRYTYTVKISDKNIGVRIKENDILWKWNDIKWFRLYSEILMIYMGDCAIYIDLKKTSGEERNQIKKCMGSHAVRNQDERLTSQYHVRSIRQLCKRNKKFKF